MALNINGTTGISGVDGSASAASIAGTDSNTGLSFASDTVNINTGGVTRTTVNSSGKVGINTESPVGKLTVDENNASEHFQLRNTTNTSNFAALGVDSSFNLRVYTNGNNERIRVDTSGHLLVSRTASIHGGKLSLDYTNGTSAGMAIKDTQTSGTGVPLQVVNGAGSIVGSISQNQSNTAFNTSSDYRLKENVVAISDGITRLKTLKPSRFNWISDLSNTTIDGFLAHEVTAVPEAVQGEKDAVATEDSERGKKGDPIYQQIDLSKLVPLLTAALQEAIGKIETLETKVAALEAA